MSAIPDYEQAGELKIGQVGIANLRIRNLDVSKICAEMADRVRSAPKLFQRAAVILDFGGLSDCPDASTVKALVDGLHGAGVLPVAIAYGTSAIESLSREVGLPLLAKFRAAYETGSVVAQAAPPQPSEPVPAAKPASAAAVPVAPPTAASPGMMHVTPVRSGQQIYAQDRDLTVCATVGAGAEVIADGSIHIYGALRGRALAGAGGLATARIFCREFNAELVAIAGTYKVLEEIPKDLIGKPVQIWLENDSLRIEALA
ncbi:MAG: septum site-determining protein MinC [Gammaproteobacteria bacterium RIFCSPHIGHO2_12_FULL_63_22]|nr:MAG: septum site-determining protein MinC [Gammaproteobacteria bacterium RIFCSPHIGHO2_12_FULL_63_22]